MYKQIQEKGVLLNMVRDLENESIIPFDPANVDYEKFKYQINHDEAQLETPDGVVMTTAEAKAYVATLP